MGIVEGMNGLRDMMPELDKRFRYAVEIRVKFRLTYFIIQLVSRYIGQYWMDWACREPYVDCGECRRVLNPG